MTLLRHKNIPRVVIRIFINLGLQLDIMLFKPVKKHIWVKIEDICGFGQVVSCQLKQIAYISLLQ